MTVIGGYSHLGLVDQSQTSRSSFRLIISFSNQFRSVAQNFSSGSSPNSILPTHPGLGSKCSRPAPSQSRGCCGRVGLTRTHGTRDAVEVLALCLVPNGSKRKLAPAHLRRPAPSRGRRGGCLGSGGVRGCAVRGVALPEVAGGRGGLAGQGLHP